MGVNTLPAGNPEMGSLSGRASKQTAPQGSISPYAYLIALSQTDTIEQARWTHALDTRREGVARRGSRARTN